MIKPVGIDACSACGACASICPCGAISTERRDGFEYPVVRADLCIGCGLCERVCPARQAERSNELLHVYAFKHASKIVVGRSSSGGAFTALSDKVLADGGAVIGAVLDEDNVVRHRIALDSGERDAMRGAKYVMSDMGGMYERAAGLVRKGKKVLFTGTPCQTEAFRNYCLVSGVGLDKVVTCALVCHGAASPEVWRSYLEVGGVGAKNGAVEVNFRDKTAGWRNNQMTMRIGGRQQVMQAYSRLFYSRLCNPRACFRCPFTSVVRNCDVTIGDFWSIQRFEEGYPEEGGVSMLLAHTERGDLLVRSCARDGSLTRVEFDPATETLQAALTCPYPKPVEYESFWRDFGRRSFSDLIEKYTGKSLRARVSRAVRRSLLGMASRLGQAGVRR